MCVGGHQVFISTAIVSDPSHIKGLVTGIGKHILALRHKGHRARGRAVRNGNRLTVVQGQHQGAAARRSVHRRRNRHVLAFINRRRTREYHIRGVAWCFINKIS